MSPAASTTTPEATTPRAAASAVPEASDGKYLLFEAGGERFGIDVLQVREIIGLQETTPVPHAPPYVRGVINLRGKVVPVIDLRTRLGFPARDDGARRCTIVCESSGPNGMLLIGVVVDAVSEVVSLSADMVEPQPEFADSKRRPYILGMAKLNGSVSILLEMDEVLARHEKLDLSAVIESAQPDAVSE